MTTPTTYILWDSKTHKQSRDERLKQLYLFIIRISNKVFFYYFYCFCLLVFHLKSIEDKIWEMYRSVWRQLKCCFNRQTRVWKIFLYYIVENDGSNNFRCDSCFQKHQAAKINDDISKSKGAYHLGHQWWHHKLSLEIWRKNIKCLFLCQERFMFVYFVCILCYS